MVGGKSERRTELKEKMWGAREATPLPIVDDVSIAMIIYSLRQQVALG